jgi:uncharacterized protein YkwD
MLRRSLPVLLAAVLVVLGASPAAAGVIEAEEQQFIYELNRARQDPAAYAAANLSGSVAADVAAVAPQPPLAVVETLGASAGFHSDEMAAHDYFGHQSEVTGDWPNAVARDHGYPLPGWLSSNANNIESIAAGFSTASTALKALIESPSHRRHLLGEVTFFADHRQVGVGFAEAPTWDYWTVHSAFVDPSDRFLTGVVYDDRNGNGRMDLGEGLSGVAIRSGASLTYSNGGGGWSLQVAGDGTYTVTAAGGNLSGEQTATAVVSGGNALVDFVAGVADPCAAPGSCDSVALVETSGRFHLLHSVAGPGGEDSFFFGDPGDVALMGDWDCDGVRTPAMYRRSNGFMYLRNSNTQGVADVEFFYGDPSDVPLAGDFDGDGCDTLAIYRADEGRVYVKNSLGTGVADYSFWFGNPGDVPFVGDFDGDGVDSVGLHRAATGFVYFRNANSTGVADSEFFYGDPGDVIVAGDWDGDGDDTVAVYRPSTGNLYVKYANTPGAADAVRYVGWFGAALRASAPAGGTGGDTPIG